MDANRLKSGGMPDHIAIGSKPSVESSEEAVGKKMLETGTSQEHLSTAKAPLPTVPGSNAQKKASMESGLGASVALKGTQRVGHPFGLDYRIPAIKARLAQDVNDVGKALDSYHHLEENPEEVKQTCGKLISSFSSMFKDPAAFNKELARFRGTDSEGNTSLHYQASLPDLTGTDTSSVNSNLSERGYHNIGHANEMFADTYVKLKKENLSDEMCLAGATMAYFHDLVQGVDGFGGTGRNENVTAQLLKHLIDTTMDVSTAKDALKDLCDATIVGGTFLMRTIDDKGVNRNRTPSEITDYSQYKHNDQPYTENKAFGNLQVIRKAMAQNDISRTNDLSFYAETMENPTNDPVIDMRNEAITNRNKAIESDDVCKKLLTLEQPVPMNMIGRMFQSIRMGQEIQYDGAAKAGKEGLSKSALLTEINEFLTKDSPDIPPDSLIKSFINSFKNPETWEKEGAFAGPSKHNEFSQLLKVKEKVIENGVEKEIRVPNPVIETIASCSDKEIAQFIKLALTEGQDGSHMDLTKIFQNE